MRHSVSRLPRSAWLATGAVVAAGASELAVATAPALLAGAAVLLALGAVLAAPDRACARAGPRATNPAAWARSSAMRTARVRSQRLGALARPPSTPLVAIAIGGTLIAFRLLVQPAQPPAGSLPVGSGGSWLATVDSVGSPREGRQVARLELKVDGGSVDVAATLPGWPQVGSGARVEVAGQVRPPPDDAYGDYLRRTGASGTLVARSLRLVDADSPVSLQALRDAAGDALATALPEPEAGLAAGILVGLRERVDRELADAFTTAGVSHVVAISGWNIAIVAGIVVAALRGRPRRIVAIIVAITIAGYTVAAGASPSVVRAAVMAGVVLVARESGRAGRAPVALAWAATLLLIVDPSMIADAGFRLSVAATAGLIAWSRSIGDRLDRLSHRRLPGWLAESLGVSLAAQAATLPDVLATFGRLSIVAPAVNLLVVPLVPVAMAAGVVALAGGALAALGTPTLIAGIAGLPGWLVLHVVVAIVRQGAAMPVASVELPPEAAMPAGVVVGIGIVLAWVAHVRRSGRSDPIGAPMPARSRVADHGLTGATEPPPPPRRPAAQRTAEARRHRALRLAALVAALAVGIGSVAVVDAATRATRVSILDVGQGDAILLQTRDGGRMLVDGGPDPARLLVELDERMPPWDRRIDVVLLTHPHEDHLSGLVRVLQRYDVGQVIDNGMRGPGPSWASWTAELAEGPPQRVLAAGDRLRVGEIALTVEWPRPGTVPLEPSDNGREVNSRSLVLLGEARGRRFLLMGDAEDDVDPALLAAGLPRVDVLKIAHHGSATATSEVLLDATRPGLAVISVGRDNPYGHPAGSTIERLRSHETPVLRTDRDGSIDLELSEAGVLA